MNSSFNNFPNSPVYNFQDFEKEAENGFRDFSEKKGAARKRTCTHIDRGASGRASLENLRWKRRFKGGTSGGWKSSLKPAPCAPPLGPRPHRFVAATVDLSTLPSSYGVKGVQPSCKKYPKHSTLPSTSRRLETLLVKDRNLCFHRRVSRKK